MTKETIDAMTWRSGSDLGFFQLSGEHGTCLRAAARHCSLGGMAVTLWRCICSGLAAVAAGAAAECGCSVWLSAQVRLCNGAGCHSAVP